MAKFFEKLTLAILKLVISLFFRKIEIVNADKIPTHGPLIYTPNHMNSLLDGLLVRAFLPREPLAIAASFLWKNPLMRPLLIATRAIPIYRQQDSKQPNHTQNNSQAFASCYQALANQQCLVLFPEGKSHHEPELQPLKTGVARIVLGSEQHHSGLAVKIIPVGITFDAKQKFRSRVLISIGDAIDPLVGIATADEEDRQAVKQVIERIEEGIKAVTLNYPNWEEANTITRAADFYISQQSNGAKEVTSSDRFQVHKQLSDAYSEIKKTYPHKAARLTETVKAYDRLLKVLSIQHEHVIQDHPFLIKAIYSFRKLSLFLIRLPLAVLGVLLNSAPFYVTGLLSRFKIRADRSSTAKLFIGLLVFPLCWSVEAMILGDDMLATFLWWLLAPLSGIASLLFFERHTQIWEELATYLKLKTQVEMKEELEDRLRNIEMEVTDFLAMPADLQPQATSRVTNAAAANHDHNKR